MNKLTIVESKWKKWRKKDIKCWILKIYLILNYQIILNSFSHPERSKMKFDDAN